MLDHDQDNDRALDQGRGGHDHNNRNRTRYQVGPSLQAEQITVLLNYPKVGPLAANTIAINLGTELRLLAPVLQSLVQAGQVRKVEHDQYIGAATQAIRRASSETPDAS